MMSQDGAVGGHDTDPHPTINKEGSMLATGKRRRIIGRVLLVTAAVGATVAVAASPSYAASSYIGSNSGGANVRTCGYLSCASIGYLSNGTGVTMLCWGDYQWVNPPLSDYGSARWFLSATPVGTGFIHSSLVENQTVVPHC
jgi:hypothetical protein